MNHVDRAQAAFLSQKGIAPSGKTLASLIDLFRLGLRELHALAWLKQTQCSQGLCVLVAQSRSICEPAVCVAITKWSSSQAI